MSRTSICSTTIVAEPLRKVNYEIWKYCIKNYLVGQDLWEVVEDNTQPPNDDEGKRKEWRRKNGAALHAIQISCSPDLLNRIKEKTDAKDAWDTLADLCKNTVEPNIQQDLSNCELPMLRKDNYRLWKVCMKDWLLEEHVWQVVVNVAEESEDGRRKNDKALHKIRSQCSPDLLEQIKEKTTAKDAWDTLATFCKPLTSQTEHPRVERDCAVTLFKAIHNNNLDFVESFFKRQPDLISARFDCNGKGKGMALHHATIAESPNIVEALIGKISDEDAIKDDGDARSALSYASNTGGKRMLRIAESLIRKNKELLTIPNKAGQIPLTTACYFGHKNMAYYLYALTRSHLPELEDQAAMIICHCIDNKMFDIALDLFRGRSLWVRLKLLGKNFYTPLMRMYHESAYPSRSKPWFWKQWIYSRLKVNPPTSSNEGNVVSLSSDHDLTEIRKIVNQEKLRLRGGVDSGCSYFLKISGIKQIYDLKVTHLFAHQLLLLISQTISKLDDLQMLPRLKDAIFNAARLGMTEFLAEVIGANPDLLFELDKNKRNIFDIAVVNRQEKTFNLIYGVGALKNQLTLYSDKNGDCLLHLAGHLPPQRMLDEISGAALQMQREIQWFKEVESIVPEAYKGYFNDNFKTPYQVFVESHKGLVSEGEKWMKDIAQSSTVVGALIITIMFAALYTVPGGNSQDTGIPLLLNEKAFKVFIVSDAISLFASSTSVLMFLGILTSRYAPQDFLTSLPTKLIIALSSLFISIAAMMVAFSATVTIMLKGRLSFVIPIVLLACIPVSLFVWLQFPLLVTIFRSTYGPGIFDRKMKKWIKNATDDKR